MQYVLMSVQTIVLKLLSHLADIYIPRYVFFYHFASKSEKKNRQ